MLSLVVPCYNEVDNVESFYDEAVRCFKGNIDEYEFVFVDDGSRDGTLARLRSVFENHKSESRIQVLSFSRNFGKEAAIFAGLNAAKGDYACIIDADLQQHPNVVVEMMNIISTQDNIDCVTAYQDERKENKLMSVFKSTFYKIINRVSDVEFVNGASDFRLFNRKVIEAIISIGEYHRFSKGIFSFVGFNTKYIPYEVKKRQNGVSKWNFIKLLKYAIQGIVAFSSFPLRLASYVGIISAVISVVYLLAVIVQKLFFSIAVPGYATIVVLLLLLGGIQLFGLGILGEYLSKVYDQVKQRPVFILKEHFNNIESYEKDIPKE